MSNFLISIKPFYRRLDKLITAKKFVLAKELYSSYNYKDLFSKYYLINLLRSNIIYKRYESINFILSNLNWFKYYNKNFLSKSFGIMEGLRNLQHYDAINFIYDNNL